MKRGGPLKRGKPLQRKTPLTSNSPLKRTGSLSRAKRLLSRPSPRMGQVERAEALQWHAHAMWTDDGVRRVRTDCAIGGWAHGDDLEVHHIVPKRILKREGYADRLWDDRNALVLCRRCHERHELAVRRVPFDLLPPQVHDFAEELGLGWVLERYYDTEEQP